MKPTGPVHRALLLALALMIAGVPAAALELAGFPPVPCEDACDGALSGEDCAPTCQVGTCAKVFAADVGPPEEPAEPRLESTAVPALLPDAQSLRLGDGIFHPPRA